MSEFDDTYNNQGVECPYCGHVHHIEGESYSEHPEEMECHECEKSFMAWQEYSVDHRAEPDCTLNKEEHKFEPFISSSGRKIDICEICGKFK